MNSGWETYALSALEGGVSGAVGAATGGMSLLAQTAASASVGMAFNAAGQYIETGEIDAGQVLMSGALDAGLGIVSDIGATKFMNSTIGKKIAGKVDEVGQAAKSKIDNIFGSTAKSIDISGSSAGNSIGVDLSTKGMDETVSYYRVQGGVGDNASQVRIQVDANGKMVIPDKDTSLYVSAYDKDHAEYFLELRGEGAELVEIEVPYTVNSPYLLHNQRS